VCRGGGAHGAGGAPPHHQERAGQDGDEGSGSKPRSGSRTRGRGCGEPDLRGSWHTPASRASLEARPTRVDQGRDGHDQNGCGGIFSGLGPPRSGAAAAAVAGRAPRLVCQPAPSRLAGGAFKRGLQERLPPHSRRRDRTPLASCRWCHGTTAAGTQLQSRGRLPVSNRLQFPSHGSCGWCGFRATSAVSLVLGASVIHQGRPPRAAARPKGFSLQLPKFIGTTNLETGPVCDRSWYLRP